MNAAGEGRGDDARRTRDHAEVEVFEVPLAGPASDPSVEPWSDAVPAGPDWRRAVGVAIVAGAVAGTVGAAVLLSDDDAGDDPPATTLADELAARITTPPTLGPVETLPPITAVGDVVDGDVVDDEPDAEPPAAGESTWDPYLGVRLPEYPDVSDVGLADLVEFDISAGVARLGIDRARRSETRIELGAGGWAIDLVLERDPTRDRYRIVVDSGRDVREAVVDVPGNRTVFVSDDGTVDEQSNDRLLADVGTETINEFFDALIVGPLRPDSFDPAATRGRGLVTIDEARVAREYATAIDGVLVPEWRIHAFAPGGEFAPDDLPDVLEYSVYLTEDAEIVQVDGRALIGDIPYLVSHRLTELDEVRIDIPVGAPLPSPTAGSPVGDDA